MTRLACLFAIVLVLAACDGAGVGDVTVFLSGEEASREGYPVGEGDDRIAFVDGYRVDFDKVLVALEAFELRSADGERAMLDVDPVVADLHRGEPVAWSLTGVSAQRWHDVRFLIAPPSVDSRVLGDVDEEDLERMIDRGYSMWVEGTAWDARDEAYRFELGFDLSVLNRSCISGFDDTDGLVVAENARVDVEITLHFDHLWFDGFTHEEALLRFEPWAASVATDDGSDAETITFDTLEGTSLSDMRDRSGDPLLDEEGDPIVYDPGSLPIEGGDLAAYVRAAATTVGHFNGEGHCEYEVR